MFKFEVDDLPIEELVKVHKVCFVLKMCESCVWKNNGGCSEWRKHEN